MSSRQHTQSIPVNEEEKILIDTLAVANNVKSATAARFLLFRGLVQFLSDKSIMEREMFEADIRRRVIELIASEPGLLKAAQIAESEYYSKVEAKKKKESKKGKTLEIIEEVMDNGGKKRGGRKSK